MTSRDAAVSYEMSAVAPEGWRVGVDVVAAVVGNVDVYVDGSLRVVIVIGDEITIDNPSTGERLTQTVADIGDGETMMQRIAQNRPWLSWMSGGSLSFRWPDDGTEYEVNLADPAHSHWSFAG